MGFFYAWRSNNPLTNSKIEISSDVNFSEPYIQEANKLNYVKVQRDLAEGKYYWRIRAKAKSGEEVTSKVSSFSVLKNEELVLLSPSNNAQLELSEIQNVLFKWKKMSSGTSYRLEISREKDFSPKLVSNEGSESFWEWKSKETGKFFWRVFSEKNGKESVSEIRTLVVNTGMEPPVLVSPGRGESIDLLTKNAISFSWKPVDKATGYRLKIWDVSGIREKLVWNDRLTNTKFNFGDLAKLNVGRFRWEVSSLFKGSDGIERESNASKQDFFVSFPELKVPKILTPGTIYVE